MLFRSGGKVVHGYFQPVFTPLTLGRPITISAADGIPGFAGYRVPSGTQLLQATIRGSNGDADLYIQDPSNNLDSSTRDGSNETLTYVNPATGVWLVFVDSYAAYSNAVLTVGPVTPTVITGSVTLPNLSGVLGSETYYKITVPSTATSLKIETSGGSGDVDLYLRKGLPPFCQSDSTVVSTSCVSDLMSENRSEEHTSELQSH